MKNAKKFDLLKIHPDKEENRRLLNKLIVLAYLPSNIISATYLLIKSESKLLDRVNVGKYLAYYERYWLLNITPEHFSVYRLPHRTNNVLQESNNGRLVQKLGIRPDAWNFTSK